jgi:hypothetical protein
MARILRITITLVQLRPEGGALEMRIDECVRTAKSREICAVQLGDHIHDKDLDFTIQLVEDSLKSAVSRTLGISDTLEF